MSENKEYVSRCDELGNIHISEEVLAGIAAAAALEVDGVSSLAANLGSDIAELLGKKNLAKGVRVKTEEDKAALVGLIEHICIDMARRIASDGEGATHLIVVESYGLPTEHDARLVAKAIAGSTLFKAAVFGRDANWGRIMAAAGYSGADVDPTKADCIIKSSAGEVQVMKDGFGTDFSEELAKAVLTEHDITVIVDFHSGDGKAVAYGCDLTYEYVKINGDYRT